MQTARHYTARHASGCVTSEWGCCFQRFVFLVPDPRVGNPNDFGAPRNSSTWPPDPFTTAPRLLSSHASLPARRSLSTASLHPLSRWTWTRVSADIMRGTDPLHLVLLTIAKYKAFPKIYTSLLYTGNTHAPARSCTNHTSRQAYQGRRERNESRVNPLTKRTERKNTLHGDRPPPHNTCLRPARASSNHILLLHPLYLHRLPTIVITALTSTPEITPPACDLRLGGGEKNKAAGGCSHLLVIYLLIYISLKRCVFKIFFVCTFALYITRSSTH